MLGPVLLLCVCAPVVWRPETDLCQRAAFPPAHLIVAAFEQNRAAGKAIDRLRAVAFEQGNDAVADYYFVKGMECDTRGQFWGALIVVQNDQASDEDRLVQLDWLRCALGDDDYFAGRLPAPCPTWR